MIGSWVSYVLLVFNEQKGYVVVIFKILKETGISGIGLLEMRNRME